MNSVSCLIVDDEPIARDIIVNYCSYLPMVNIIAACGNALEAKNILNAQPVDIIFLDIHMPVLDGISFLKTIKLPPQVIFTTAYKEYAVNAFDLSACDYLVKPFSLERFIIAVDKALEKLNVVDKITPANKLLENDYLFIKSDGKMYRIIFEELLYAEAKGNYTQIATANNFISPNISFTNFEKMIPLSRFLRVHRSFIINKSKIDYVEGNRLFINKIEIPIGSTFKESFFNAMRL